MSYITIYKLNRGSVNYSLKYLDINAACGMWPTHPVPTLNAQETLKKIHGVKNGDYNKIAYIFLN